MKNPISSFIFLLSSFALPLGRHLSSVLRHLISIPVLCLLSSVLCLSVSAQSWIIDGRKVQTLNLNVSDPQALYTDGSREIAGTIPLADSLMTTGGLFRAYIPWRGLTADLFQMDMDDESIRLCDDGNVSFQVGEVLIDQSGIAGFGVSVGFEDNSLFGGWKTSTVIDNNKAILNRSYADARYLQRTEGITTNHTIQAGDVLQIQNGLITAINP